MVSNSDSVAVVERIDLADPVMFNDPYPRYAELRRLAPVVCALADAEGLVAHRRDVEVRR